MKIDALVSMARMADHLAPVWRKLPENVRGTFWVHDRALKETQRNHRDIFFQSFRNKTGAMMLKGYRYPVITSCGGSISSIVRSGRQPIIMEHSCGDTFGFPRVLSPMSLIKSTAKYYDKTLLYLAPGYHAAEIFKKNRPGIPVEIIGCPKLDKWHKKIGEKERNDPPVVVISFTWDWQDKHWSSRYAKLIKGAWSHYVNYLPKLLDQSWVLYGNCHPKMTKKAKGIFAHLGIPFIERFDEVLEKADLYICDISSTIFEFASTGRPVILLNAPWHDKKVKQGLRFWKAADVGIQVDGPNELIPAIERALEDPPEVQRRREEILDYVYPIRDGTAAERAAKAILKTIEKNPNAKYITYSPGRKVELTAEKSFTLGIKQIMPGDKFKVDAERGKELFDRGLATL